MINRELIRLKVVQLIYAYYRSERTEDALENAEKELFFSFDKSYELYLYLLNALLQLKKVAESKEETRLARATRLGQETEGVYAEKMFAENKFLCQLDLNEALVDYREKQKKEWIEEDAFYKKLYTTMVESDIYQMYLAKEDFSYDADREIVRKLYKTFIGGNEDFDVLLEDHCLYWNDDKFLIDSFVLKTIKRFEEANGAQQPLLPQFSLDEDREFASALFREAIKRKEEVKELISKNCKNWEYDRLAFMDVIIMQIAIAEILAFPSIPLSVTFNEYLDIAKVYSTPRSASYINGLMDHVVKRLKAEGKLMKA